jgi:hypothetical protein
MTLMNADSRAPTAWGVLKILGGIALACYVVILIKPAFYLVTLDHPSMMVVGMELGTPTKQTTNDKSQLVMVYRAGTIRPLCIEYVLTFHSNTPNLQEWKWSLVCD